MGYPVRALLLVSILGNYTIGQILSVLVRNDRKRPARALLAAGVALNLLVLAGFKYANFFLGNVNDVAGTQFVLAHIILPLGISFFTFEQIRYLVDIKRGHIYNAEFLSYAVVSFFPRPVAGPILHYSEIEPQLPRESATRPSAHNLAAGLTIFLIGLAGSSIGFGAVETRG